MPDYIPNYETPVDNGLDPNGWWPGKKHSWKERLGQVATLGIWNPDDRTSSENNKMQLKSRAANNEVLYEMTQNLIKVGIDPQEAAKMANDVYASKYKADIEANRASEAESGKNRAVSEGYKPLGREIGMRRGEQDSAAARSATELNTNIGDRARAEGDLGVPAAQAFNTKEEANATLGELTRGQEQRAIEHKRFKDAEAERQMLEGKTLGTRMDTATSKAQADAAAAEVGRIQAQTEAGLMRNPGLAERIQRLELNKRLGVPTPYGGAVGNLLDASVGEQVRGPEHLAPAGSGMVGGYTVTEEKRDPITGQTYQLQKTRSPLLPAPAPIVSPSGQTPQVLPNLPQAPGAQVLGPGGKPIRLITK